MNQLSTLPRQLMRWVEETRTYSPALRAEADGLLARLGVLDARQQYLNNLQAAPLALGLYGHSLKGKQHLLKALIAGGNEWVGVQLGEHCLNYLSHINPGETPATMAVRFTAKAPPRLENYPLQLTLYNQNELTQRMISRHHQQPHPRPAQAQHLQARLNNLQSRRQAEGVSGMTPSQAMAAIRFYHQQVRSPFWLDDALQYQLAELAAGLSLADRARLLSPLWGDDDVLSRLWLQQAKTLEYLDNADSLLAPASLVINPHHFAVKTFLLPHEETLPELAGDVIVSPLRGPQILPQRNVSRHDLRMICAELVLTVSDEMLLPDVDIIDIPPHQLEYYASRGLPDTLLICDAVVQSQNASKAITALSRWLAKTQHSTGDTLPRLVWAITPYEPRVSGQMQPDMEIQRVLARLGKRWGTLQAWDRHDVYRLLEWLREALNPACRARRLNDLQQALTRLTNEQVQRFILPPQQAAADTQKQAEALVRQLQGAIAQHGDLLAALTLTRESVQRCREQYEAQLRTSPPGSRQVINLFASTDPRKSAPPEQVSFAGRVFQHWVNHLRQLSYRDAPLSSSPLDEPLWQFLCHQLIAIAYQQGLDARLEQALAETEDNSAVAITQATALVGDFISWLGYETVDAAHRPPSPVNIGGGIFMPWGQATTQERLRLLETHAIPHSACYLYDWLVAFYSRITQCTDDHSPQDIGDEQRLTLLAVLTPSPPEPG